MPIGDFELKAIDAERYGEKGEKKNIRIDHNSSVTQIKKVSKNKNDVSFRFTANYTGIGMIKIEGELRYLGKYPGLAKKWKKEKEMPNEVAKEIHSAIINNCIPQAVIIARDIQLPPPIPMPQVDMPDEEEGEQARGGMEVA